MNQINNASHFVKILCIFFVFVLEYTINGKKMKILLALLLFVSVSAFAAEQVLDPVKAKEKEVENPQWKYNHRAALLEAWDKIGAACKDDMNYYNKIDSLGKESEAFRMIAKAKRAEWANVYEQIPKEKKWFAKRIFKKKSHCIRYRIQQRYKIKR